MAEQRNIVIIGSGMAGYSLLREIRKIDPEIGITLICSDSGDFYSKPMLSNALASHKNPDSLVSQMAQAMVESQHFELIPNTTITGIDTESTTIHSESGSWHYRKLVLATGAKPFALPMQGDGAGDILTVNHLDDYRGFFNKLDHSTHIAIIGPGLIGCEFANDLRSIDKQVVVIGPDPWPISNLLPQKAGAFLQQKLQQAGVDFYLQNSVKSVDRSDQGYRLQLQSGEPLHADLVMSAVGLRANLELAENTALSTNRGFVTNRFLQTSIDNIHALGDCAEVEGLHLPFILPIMQCARALAKTLTGTPTEVIYPAMPVVIKTPACPLVVASPPSVGTLEWRYTESEDGIKALCYIDNELAGFVLAGQSVSEKQQLTRSLPPLW